MVREGAVEDLDLVDGMITSHLPWAVVDVAAGPSNSSRVRRATAGDLRIVACTTGGGYYRRRRREIALTTGSYVGLLMVRAGQEILEQDGRQATVGPGSLIAWDSDRSAACVIPGPVTTLSLFVPRERFARVVRRPELMVMRALPPSQSTRLLRALLDELLDSAPLDADTVPAAGGAALELLRAVCCQALPRARSWDGAVALRTALEYIDQNLGDPRLDPTRVARAAGVSLRQLYELFAARNEPVWTHIKQRRLVWAHDELARVPAQGSIANVARAAGFTNSAHFTRAFRDRFGETPSTVRRRAALAAGLAEAS